MIYHDLINSEAKSACYLCGSHGKTLHRDCKDRLFGVPGNWTLKQCINTGCNLVWLDPMPTRNQINKAYKKYYTHKNKLTSTTKKHHGIFKQLKHMFRMAQRDGYLALRYRAMNQASVLEKLAGLIVSIQPARKAVFDFKAMYLTVKPGARLLDIGCGNGDHLKFLQGLGWQVEGIDPDPLAVEIVAARGIKVHTGTLENQHFSDHQFDAIISCHVIEHVHDPVSLLRECGRILRPGGKLVIITPNTASWGHKWFGSNWRGLEPPRHLYIFNTVALRRTAEKAGLSICALSSTVRDAEGIFRASYAIQNNESYDCSWFMRRWSRAMQFLEWLLLKAGLDRGEELMMICTKKM